MNKNIMRAAGFGEQVRLVEQRRCPTCGEYVGITPHAVYLRPVKPGQIPEIKNLFRDDLSFKEFGISGMCQKCQDKTFTPAEDPCQKCRLVDGEKCHYGFTRKDCPV
jgi:hypothetical protein